MEWITSYLNEWTHAAGGRAGTSDDGARRNGAEAATVARETVK